MASILKKSRTSSNIEIVQNILHMMDEFPDLRFFQILYNLNIVLNGKDQFYEESFETAKRSTKTIEINKF